MTSMPTLTSHVTVVPPAVLFCNGMNTTKKAAQAMTQELADAIGREVYLHYNGATSPAETTAIGTFAGLGIAAGGSSLFMKDEGNRRTARRVGGLCGLVALAGYAFVQKKKSAEGKRLADRVSRYLDQDPRAHVVLILYSQGADVGSRALEHLGEYKNRIKVVTIGPSVQIPSEHAHEIMQLQNSDDWISRVAVAINGLKSSAPKAPITRISAKSTDRTSHSLGTSYLGNPGTARKVRNAVQDRCFTGSERVSCGCMRA